MWFVLFYRYGNHCDRRCRWNCGYYRRRRCRCHLQTLQVSDTFIYTNRNTRSVQKVLQLDHNEEWKCYKLHFIFQYNLY